MNMAGREVDRKGLERFRRHALRYLLTYYLSAYQEHYYLDHQEARTKMGRKSRKVVPHPLTLGNVCIHLAVVAVLELQE